MSAEQEKIAEAIERSGLTPSQFADAMDALTPEQIRIAQLETALSEAQRERDRLREALEFIRRVTSQSATESRSRDEDRRCIADVMQVSRAALTPIPESGQKPSIWREYVKSPEGQAEYAAWDASRSTPPQAGASADTRRLDWLERDMRCGRDDLQFLYRYFDLRLEAQPISDGWGSSSIRAAIDAAMSNAEQKEGE